MNNGQVQNGEETQEERREEGTAPQDQLTAKMQVEL
jgi:hypothetical protein